MRDIWLRPAVLALLSALASGCAQGVTARVFPEVGRIERELKPGVSTKADVEKVLGTRKGVGNAVLPADPRPYEIWDYSDIEATGRREIYVGLMTQSFEVDLRQQVLWVFVDKEVFDGFVWWSNMGEPVSVAKTGTMPASWVNQVEFGWLPRTDPIKTLKPGVSTKADVVLALGEPRGNGMARFRGDQPLREVWYYEFTHIENWRISLKFLLVFIQNGRYDGHLIWSSQAQAPEQKR